MDHPKFSDTRWVEDLAHAILDMAAERDYWRRQTIFYQAEFEKHNEFVHNSIKASEKSMADMLTSILDPNSGINCMARAVQRDPLKGAVKGAP